MTFTHVFKIANRRATFTEVAIETDDCENLTMISKKLKKADLFDHVPTIPNSNIHSVEIKLFPFILTIK